MHLVNLWFDRYFKNVAISFNDPVSPRTRCEVQRKIHIYGTPKEVL